MTGELDSELTPERIGKSVIDVGNNIQTNHRTVSISGKVPRNDNFNIKATEVNKELSTISKRGNYISLIIATLTRKHT